MADYRTSRVYRDRRDSDSDDERHKSTTITRYKVNPRGDRYERTEKVDMDDDRRSRHDRGERSSNDFVEYERRERGYVPDRPRSAFDVEADRSRTAFYERDIERRESDRDWDRRSRHDRHEDDVRVEKRVEERFEDSHGHEVDRYRKETDYYRESEQPSSPVIVRQRAPDQKIIVQEAPAQQFIIPRQDPGIIVLREKESDRELVRAPYDEEYYYRHERREVGPYRGNNRHRHRQGRDEYWSDDDDYYYSRRTVRRERSESPDHHHKRHLAEGALAGAGITALLSSRSNEYGDLPDNRGKKVLAGAALGALGTEALRRAHHAYEENWGDGRESPDHHSKLKKGLGIAAVALAAAGAVKYHQASKIEKEEHRRGRSRTRGYSSSGGDYSRSRSRRPSRKRSLSTLAKAAIGTAATAGIVKHFRDKSKSRSRNGSRSRSKSKLGRGAKLAGAAAAAGVAGKLWKDHREKKKDRERSASRGLSDSEYDRDESVGRSRSGSRSRSRPRSLHSDAGADPELGLVEYGGTPLHPDPRSPSGQGYESEAEARRRSRRRRRDRSRSSSASDQERKRSRSRLRDMAAAGAAAIGIKEYKDRKDKEKKERRSKERRSKERDEEGRRPSNGPPNGGYFDEQRPHSPPTASGGAYYPPYPMTPGVGPGGQGYTPYTDPNVPPPQEYQPYIPQDYTGYAPPPPPAGPPPPSGPPPPTNSGAPGYGPHLDGTPHNGPAPPPGPPPPGPPPAGSNFPPDHVSDLSRNQNEPNQTNGKPEAAVKHRKKPPPIEMPAEGPANRRKSVSFGPLSPTSSKTMKRHRMDQVEVIASDGSESESESADNHRKNFFDRLSLRHRQSSDTTHDRPSNRDGKAAGRERHGSDLDSENEIEDLPDRFDSQGKRLDANDADRSRWTTRKGEFHRPPQQVGDWDVQGAWQVGGTDQERIEKLVRHVTGALEGRRSWVGVIGEVLGGEWLEPPPGTGNALQQAEGREGSEEGGGRDGERRNEIEDGDPRGDRKRKRRR